MSRLVVLLVFFALAAGEADPKPEAKADADVAPSYGAPPVQRAPSGGYGAPAPSYGPPPKPKDYCPKKCYDKTAYETITKKATEHYTYWNTENQVNTIFFPFFPAKLKAY